MIHCWDIITIGNLSRNRYWGESDDRAYRSALCTNTLISGLNFRLLVDAPLGDAQTMTSELNRRTGLNPSDIDAVFLTHEHGDHVVGLTNFPDADWLAAAPVAQILNDSGRYPLPIQSVENRIFDVIDVLHTPGHTMSHHSLRFDWEGQSVVIAADAAMTRDFFKERRGYFNSVDFEAAARTIDELAQIADIIVPGHDNYFLVPSH